jgi:hypothetical protein
MALTLPTPRYQEMVACYLSELALPDLTRLVEIGVRNGAITPRLHPRG